ncbi:MotA/TolQ/ExbB proton channel family protein [Campylobacter canadensis]|uniref:MotA/TolQ/ExbB proton channel family protein n=1 Tax=Campylobacter canadensis TaxID=449520 RepID=A0ABS7WRI3_9BACT|nr:MotA/TolQ/ExbB proton channel family protein [Campylobacter canadensis]MBZ7987362.1 MotA/TolQ/ExbB proton channel family protein [Campylobacter canadensis]MBZ7994755.1 MotA/TolQ/ExbB proton channel family protein [Campylobacter canadensis]MBZ7996537.1 MotA/TolQ/ExbB proton channel family protein [Campylobacter canadensis]MBZ7998467.1 MotA/TolQ/ExbB proton channel family protein [Campylobacter canadensis]MBZ8000181.1 MotA/TolQ/ExbB proton channel family protein [Campylobacter canadensis]
MIAFLKEFDIATMVAIFVLIFYMIISLAIFLYKIVNLNSFFSCEAKALNSLVKNKELSFDAYLKPCEDSKSKLQVYKNTATRKLSEGLTWLGIIATTSPFIGLFGTVVSIYITLTNLTSTNDISKIANPIGHALIATAAGIICAVLAYTFHLLVKRKIFDCMNVIDSQVKILEDE